MRSRRFSVHWKWAMVAASVVFAGCSSGDDAASPVETVPEPSVTAAEPDPAEAEPPPEDDADDEPVDPVPTGPSPGVTDETITIGITHVDVEALLAVGLDFELGDHRAVYQALIDDINEAGGIHGRRLEPVFAAINPTNAQSADEVCLQLTEDADVFLITGFFLLDAVLCPVELHETAVVGGTMTPERVARANAPWATWLADTDQPRAVVRTMHERGELDGRVGVYAADDDLAALENHVAPLLDELGVDVVATGIMDAPTDDPAAIDLAVERIAERFESEGVDVVVVVGASGSTWPQYLADDTSYRPDLRFLTTTAVNAFATTATTTDTSILEGSLAGGGYGPDQARYDEAEMQVCVATLAERGIETPTPSLFDADDQSNQPYQAAFQACPDMALTVALLEAAGPTLNYGTLAAALDGLELSIPGDPSPRVYGPASEGAGDGNPVAYLYAWDPDTRGVVPVDQP